MAAAASAATRTECLLESCAGEKRREGACRSLEKNSKIVHMRSNDDSEGRVGTLVADGSLASCNPRLGISKCSSLSRRIGPEKVPEGSS